MDFQEVLGHVNAKCTGTAAHARESECSDIISHGVSVDNDGGERRDWAKPTAVNNEDVDFLRREIGFGEEVFEDWEENHFDFLGGFMVV